MAYDTPDSFVELRRRLEQQIGGMSEQAAVDKIRQFADQMAASVKPENREETLLKEMWQLASEEEKRALASVLYQLVKKAEGQTHTGLKRDAVSRSQDPS